MVSPGLLFAGHRYVSDVLEELLDAAEARRAVRAYALRLLDAAPASLRDALRSTADYVGGKCMGYPAIWFLSQLLEESPEAIVERCRATLCISLSTSIVDDLSDGDEPCGDAYLAYLYVLVGESAFGGGSAPKHRALLHDALASCIGAGPAESLASRRGDRIGAFFAMIASEALETVGSQEKRENGILASRAFGRFCAHVDDAMDAERDLLRGETENVALVLLRDRLGRAPAASDLAAAQPWLDDDLQRLFSGALDDAARYAETFGAPFSQRLRSIV